jgi:hypothetical protein
VVFDRVITPVSDMPLLDALKFVERHGGLPEASCWPVSLV